MEIRSTGEVRVRLNDSTIVDITGNADIGIQSQIYEFGGTHLYVDGKVGKFKRLLIALADEFDYDVMPRSAPRNHGAANPLRTDRSSPTSS